jgi:hypothetical protein
MIIYLLFHKQIWTLRISMLFKLKLFKEAEIELKQFENFEFFYEHLQDHFPNRKGCRLIHCTR